MKVGMQKTKRKSNTRTNSLQIIQKRNKCPDQLEDEQKLFLNHKNILKGTFG